MRNAIRALRERRESDDQGFTLIELMVVVLIIAILIAIAIPTFLGARNRANQRAAQSSLRNGLTASKTFFTDGDTYVGANAAALAAIEPSLTFTDNTDVKGANPVAKTVSVLPVSATVWEASAMSADGTCYFIKDDSSGGGGGTQYGSTPSAGTCKAGDAPTNAYASKW